jgi:two-component system response regulator (stage 0 sporulation protein A)
LKAGAETKSAAVVMLSANVVEQARSRALALGASCFVAKPFQMEKLITTIRDVIGLGDRTRRSDRSIAAGPDRARADAGRLKFRH